MDKRNAKRVQKYDEVSCRYIIKVYNTNNNKENHFMYSNNPVIAYCEYMSVKNDILGPAKPLSHEALYKIFSFLNKDHIIISPELLENNVLYDNTYKSNKFIIWWERSHKREVKIKNKKLSIYPVPALLYAIYNNKFFVFALKTNKRPDMNTPLYSAPFDNTFNFTNIYNSNVCLGNVDIDNNILNSSKKTIDIYMKAWWQSDFTNSTILLDKAKKTGRFPYKNLVNTNLKIKDLFK